MPPESTLPTNIAVPLCDVACRLLNRPPILSYDGYALYNWKRFDPTGPIALGNIDTIQNFVHMYDEHWFILVHVEIEATRRQTFSQRSRAEARTRRRPPRRGDRRGLAEIARRSGSRSSAAPDSREDGPASLFQDVSPHIRFFETRRLRGRRTAPSSYRGETGVVEHLSRPWWRFLKIPHRPSRSDGSPRGHAAVHAGRPPRVIEEVERRRR